MKNLFIINIFLFLLSCQISSHTIKQSSNLDYALFSMQDSSFVRMIIRGPAQCGFIFTCNISGNAEIKMGINDSVRNTAEFAGFQKVLKNDTFHLEDKDIDSIVKLVNYIKRQPFVKGKFVVDGYRHELFIQGNKKVDVYGSYPESFGRLLNILSRNLPFKLEDQNCF